MRILRFASLRTNRLYLEQMERQELLDRGAGAIESCRIPAKIRCHWRGGR